MKSAQMVATVLLCALALAGFVQGWRVRADLVFQSARMQQLQRLATDLRQPVDPALSDFWQSHPPQALPDQAAFFKADIAQVQTTHLAQGWVQQVLPVRMHFQVENEAGFSSWLAEVAAIAGAKRATSCVLERDAGIRGYCDWEWQALEKVRP